jgi:hypothetical protein
MLDNMILFIYIQLCYFFDEYFTKTRLIYYAKYSNLETQKEKSNLSPLKHVKLIQRFQNNVKNL